MSLKCCYPQCKVPYQNRMKTFLGMQGCKCFLPLHCLSMEFARRRGRSEKGAGVRGRTGWEGWCWPGRLGKQPPLGGSRECGAGEWLVPHMGNVLSIHWEELRNQCLEILRKWSKSRTFYNGRRKTEIYQAASSYKPMANIYLMVAVWALSSPTQHGDVSLWVMW